jgi:putative nucleotidyltransferase with HDIG domain
VPDAILTLNEPVLRSIGRIADRDGVRAYAVGGYVRDLLLGRDVKDIDITVIGNGIAFARSVARELGVQAPVVFETFGTAMIAVEGRNIEFVGARKESYRKDSRKPEVASGTLEEDLARRDFTVNGLAVGLHASERDRLIDRFDGRCDLERRLLRTPLDPTATFDDDPLRIMRTMRFAAQLEFSVEPSVLASATAMRDRLSIVSPERVADEFLKMMQAPRPSIGLQLMFDTGVLHIVVPEVARLSGVDQRKDFHHKDVFLHTLKVVDNICQTTDNVWLRVAALLHDIAKPKTKAFKEGIGWTFHGHEELGARMVRPMFRRLRFPLHQVPYVEKLVRLHLRPMALVDSVVTDSAVRRLMFDAGDAVDDLMLLCHADITSKNPRLVERVRRNYDLVIEKMKEVEEKDQIRSWQPPLRGEEIMQLTGLPAGPLVGALKDAVIDAILDGRIANDHDAAVKHLLAIKDAMISEAAQTGRVQKQSREELFRGKRPPDSAEKH